MEERKQKSPNPFKGKRGQLKSEPSPDPGFKMRVILDYLEGNRDQRTVAAIYGISQTCLCLWIKTYLGNKATPMGHKKKKPFIATEESELKALKKQLEEERLKNLALQELIQVAEKQFNIPILKKPGAKQ